MPRAPPVIRIVVAPVILSASEASTKAPRRGMPRAPHIAWTGAAPWLTLRFAQGARRSRLLLIAILQRRDHRRIRERRHVPQRATLGDVAQEPPHDLAAASLRQIGGDEDLLRPRDRADLLRDVLLQLLLERDRILLRLVYPRGLHDHERGDGRPLDLVIDADARRFGDRG